MRRLTDRTANTLRALGVGKGDRVAVMAPASPEIAAGFLATYKVEAILLSMSVLYGDESIVYRLNDSGAKVLITSAAHRDRVAALLDKAPSVERLVVVGGTGDESFEELTGAASDRFEALWEQRPVARWTSSRKTIDHPEVGPITMDCDVLRIAGTDLELVVFTTDDASTLAMIGALGLQSFTR